MPHTDLIVDGVKYPSVTEILGDKPKPWLVNWQLKWGVLAVRKTACANVVGTAFHAGAESLSKRQDVTYPANRRLGKMLERVEEWLTLSEFKPLHTELHVVSKAYKYHGTLDAIGYLGRHIVLIDYKSSSAIYPEMAEQLVAYAQAYFEETGVWIKRGIIVHVSKDKPTHKLTVKEYPLNKRLLNKFLKRLREYNEVRGL